jgi:hypothetical protein
VLSSEHVARGISCTVRRMDATWILWGAVLIGWPLAGVGLAYLFGEIAPNDEAPEDTTLSPRMSYVPSKRGNALPRVSRRTARRSFFGGRRLH